MDAQQVEWDAEDYIRTEVARGRRDCAAIVEGTVEYLHSYGEPDDLRALAWRLVGPQFAAHLQAQESWPARTDNDRLTDAFRKLDAAGIVAREDFACCQNCGTGEIGGEVTDAAPARGYVFYHYQDAENAVQGGNLWLAYGLFDQPGNEPQTALIGEEIAAALRAEGLHVDWDGSAGQRIQVRITWARRRHGALAAYLTEPAGPEVDLKVTKGKFRLAWR